MLHQRAVQSFECQQQEMNGGTLVATFCDSLVCPFLAGCPALPRQRALQTFCTTASMDVLSIRLRPCFARLCIHEATPDW
mmetsp:Transcript_19454/g.45230  ORF Transcript_19454/g.45230 Transcript_19454/m.45230 type:complete len:80 (+) Transcript_19454:751-990(+)